MIVNVNPRVFVTTEPQFEGVTGISAGIVRDMVADGRGQLAQALPTERVPPTPAGLDALGHARFGGGFCYYEDGDWWYLCGESDPPRRG